MSGGKPFRVVADWEPAGDQPKAIDELSEALLAGEDRLTLLGATGTGKSLDWHEPILVYRQRSDGTRVSECLPIGELVDEMIEADDHVERGPNGTEISRWNRFGYYALSINPKTCQVELKPITAFVRHDAPKKMFRLRTRCGREAVMTGDHNLWVLRDSELKLIETHEAKTTDLVPLPKALPSIDSKLEYVNLQELATDQGSKSDNFVDQPVLAPVLPERFPLTDDFLSLVGRYLATGLADDVTDRPQTVWILQMLCGSKAHELRLPRLWGALSQQQLAVVLRAYYDELGVLAPGVEVNTTTTSRNLAFDLCCALLRFGIWAKVNEKGSRVDQDRHLDDLRWQVSITGKDNLKKLARWIGFTSTALSLPAAVGESPGTAVSLVQPWNQRHDSSGASDVSDTAVGRVSSRPDGSEKRGTDSAGQDDLVRLYPFGNVQWAGIADVEPIAYDRPYVYDVSVADNETFFGGFGGMFVHNTYTMAKVIERVQKPTLVMAHNKTLAAQLCSEFRAFFPDNAVHYFISYYDYYQPEAYIPRTDTYIEKDSAINDEIDRLRHAATSALFERRDVVIVASVSCIYGLGSPEDYVAMTLSLKHGDFRDRDKILRKLVGIQYTRNDVGFTRGTFRVRGDVIEIVPAYEENVIRIELFGDEVDRILELDPVTGEVLAEKDTLTIYPATHFITPEEKMKRAIESIQEELQERLAYFKREGMLLEAQRLEQRTLYDLEMLQEVGVCQGIENYSRHLTGRREGEPPATLLDYFPGDFLMFIDESHQTIPQVNGMYRGDRSRKETLVEYGFRLPSALDNRPLKFEEFEQHMNQVVFVSATPGPYEQKTSRRVVEQIIRPTGLVDPEVVVRPIEGQIDDLLHEINQVVARGERVLVTTLTKKMAEDLTDYFADVGVRVRYLHSEIEALERSEILRDLRLGEFDVLVGINLLREGLDLPEVSLVAILDADKEGFLRSDTSLIQTIGRAARNVNGKVIMYADQITGSMQRAIDETNRRREIQMAYNEEHGITPETVRKRVFDVIRSEQGAEEATPQEKAALDKVEGLSEEEVAEHIQKLEDEMFEAAKNLEFERAAELRDEIEALRKNLLQFTG